MKRFFVKSFLIMVFLITLFIITPKTYASSFLADKAEIEIKLDVPGANALCQSDDGYIWIGQYSGITRYDSNKFEKFTEFYEDDVRYDIKTVKSIVNYGNTIFFSSADHLYRYENDEFHNINIGRDDYIINELTIYSDLLYVSTSKGLYVYEIPTNRIKDKIQEDTNIEDTVVINNYIYYQKTDGVYNINDERIFPNPKILDMISYGNIIIMGTDKGLLAQYDATKNEVLEKEYDISTQINKLMYSEKEDTLFIAAEHGLFSIKMSNDSEVLKATNLMNNESLVDLLMDYEGNLWFATYSNGVSMLSKNALSDLLFDVPTTEFVTDSRRVDSIEKYGDILYIAFHDEGIKFYDLKSEKMIENNPVQAKINQYRTDNSVEAAYAYFDVEVFKNKMYFAVFGLGLVEYNFSTKEVKIYDRTYINTSSGSTSEYSEYLRCLKAFDDFLIIGYRYGMEKFDGTNFIVSEFPDPSKYPLYIDKGPSGNINFVYNHLGVYSINDNIEISSIESVNPNGEIIDGVLKFMYDENGKVLYYTSFGKLYKLENNTIEEINVPNVKGSIVELSKVGITNSAEDTEYRYVLASENQVYIAKDIKNGFNNYNYYDSTNGLKQGIKANTVGYYDKENNKYYFQSLGGIFSYDFGFETEAHQPLKNKVNSILVDDQAYYGNNLKLKSNIERITFNLSVFAFRPNKGYKVYYKLDGVDKDYVELSNDTKQVSYTNLKGGKYTFHFYAIDESGQKSINEIAISFTKTKHVYEHIWFIILMVFLALAVLVGTITLFFMHKIRLSKKRELEYKKITLESIEAIARTIDVKDAYTNGHSRRVGYYSREIAKAMGLGEKEVENIFYTALLHDIGKIGIPIKIINKPSRLDDDEFAVMKTHTTKGGKILKDMSTIPNIVEGAMYHHEKYNGTGYPSGLKGEEIPLIARIICCADCFDAMATRRSYKEPCTKEYIINEFERCKGTQFDPEIADVIIKLIKEDKFKTILEEDTKHKNDDIVTIEDSKETK